MQAELKRIILEYEGNVIMVTHSRDEAYKIADNLVILDRGRLAADGPAREVFRRPGNARAARVTGCKNISAIGKRSGRRFFAKDWGLEFEAAEPVEDRHAYVGIRAHDFMPARQERIQEGTVHASSVQPSSFTQNVFNIEIIDEIEGPFEKDYIVRPEGGAGRIWWIAGRDIDAGAVRALSVAPEAILLLEE